jgi:hypothetical protein
MNLVVKCGLRRINGWGADGSVGAAGGGCIYVCSQSANEQNVGQASLRYFDDDIMSWARQAWSAWKKER